MRVYYLLISLIHPCTNDPPSPEWINIVAREEKKRVLRESISPAWGARNWYVFEGPSNVSIHGYISLSPAARNGAERGLAISRFPPPSILLSSSITDRVAQNVRFEILNPFFPTPPISSIFASRSLRLCYDNHVCRFRAPLAFGLAACTPVSVPIIIGCVYKENVSAGSIREIYVEPMWERRDENYYWKILLRVLRRFFNLIRIRFRKRWLRQESHGESRFFFSSRKHEGTKERGNRGALPQW